MPAIHLLNVAPGDCTVIRHGSGRVTMVDVCDGNIAEEEVAIKAALAEAFGARPSGNFGMCDRPTNPIDYVRGLGITEIYRFVLTHPDCDHMDGLDTLADAFTIHNFWDSGVRREKPSFDKGCQFKEEDWDRYAKLRDGRDGTNARVRFAGHRFAYANKDADGNDGGDGLTILAPSQELSLEACNGGDLNDGSYVLLYRHSGGTVLLPGDAHDKTWEYILNRSLNKVQNCSFLLAPHHGRDSERSYDFLGAIRPKLTLIGCAPSEYIDYGQWRRLELDYITSNQAGNVVLEFRDTYIAVYIQNESYARARGCDLTVRNSQGYYFLTSI